jgi:hypothetical protein
MSLDPTIYACLVRGTERREFRIATSTTLDAWPYWIDRGEMPVVGVARTPERALTLRAEIDEEIAAFKAAGWVEA